MARFQRTTKKLAQRIDLDYFKQQHPLQRYRFLLTIAALALTVAWLAWYGLARSNRQAIFSQGPLSPAHAAFGRRCELCHVPEQGGFRRSVTDQSCLACHDGPGHNPNQVFTPSCSSCHQEHRGTAQLTAVSDRSCTQCHAALRTGSGPPRFENVSEFRSSGHPQFAAKRDGFSDPGTIKFNHLAHVEFGGCASCHVPENRIEPSVGDAARLGAAGSTRPEDPVGAIKGAYMLPIKFADHCLSCHSDKLELDNPVKESVPHDTPEVIHAAILKQAAPGVPIAELETALWKDKCTYCHTMILTPGGLPKVVSSSIPVRWFGHADFSHTPHRMFTCQSCHANAPTSKLASDILLPGVSTCQDCHRAGNFAPSGCYECHAYHDWRNEKSARLIFDFGCLKGGGGVETCRTNVEEQSPKKP